MTRHGDIGRTRKAQGGVLLAMALGLAGSAAAQSQVSLREEVRRQPVALVADSVSYDEAAGTVTASGNVEVYQGDRTLTASRIVYDSRADRITATGPIVLRDSTGSTVLADAAELDASLRNGVVEGARAVIGNGAGTIAAVEGQRIDGRYSSLQKVVYSSCDVCFISPTPLWQVRARRVVHDEQERMIHYEDAWFDVMGVPVAWLPYFSHPDPSVERKSGFLAPTIQQSSVYGLAAKIPYFIDLGPSRDLTLTAFPTLGDGPLLEAEYRQRFDFGRLDLAGSVGLVDTGPDNSLSGRGHLFGSGDFAVGDAMESALGFGAGSRAGFQLQTVTDDSYLDRYDFSDLDRLESEAHLERYAPTGYFRLNTTHFRSLRETEPDGKNIYLLPEFALRETRGLGEDFGTVGFDASAVVLTRPEGRDTARMSVGLDWEKEAILPMGLALRGFASGRIDGYLVDDDGSPTDGTSSRIYPQAGVEARYPLIADIAGTTHLIEPAVQFIVSPQGLNPDDIPNEDSVIVEFDDNNIFDTNRFPGYDRVETGSRMNVGLRYARVADDPFTLDASIGRVFRLSDQTAFSSESGLADSSSDIVASFGVGFAPWVNISNRLRFDDGFELRRNEIEGTVSTERLTFAASYVFLGSDPAAGASDDRAEFNASAELALDSNWSIGGLIRHDVENSETVRIGGRIGYRNECAALELFLGRDYASRDTDDPETLIGLRVQVLAQADPRRNLASTCGRIAARNTEPGRY